MKVFEKYIKHIFECINKYYETQKYLKIIIPSQ